MAKKFMYACFGILALAIAFHLGARYGSASIVDHSTTGIIAYANGALLLDNGQCWGMSDGQWQEYSVLTPPVPVSELKFWDDLHIVTHTNEGWYCDESGWHNLGVPPPLQAGLPYDPDPQPTTWGQMKSMHK